MFDRKRTLFGIIGSTRINKWLNNKESDKWSNKMENEHKFNEFLHLSFSHLLCRFSKK